jgi:hypothetical protein
LVDRSTVSDPIERVFALLAQYRAAILSTRAAASKDTPPLTGIRFATDRLPRVSR